MVVFFVLLLVICGLGIFVSTKMSPYTERFMRRIWDDETNKARIKIARRVKELCIDADIPDETAALMIASENGLMEEQVKDMMKEATADPALMRMAFGSKVGSVVYRGLKKFGGAK